MKAKNFKNVDMEMAILETVDGRVIPGLWTELRVKNDSIPDGFHKYSTRHDDNGDWVTPVTIERHNILVNFCGEFTVPGMVSFGSENYIEVKEFYFVDEETFFNAVKNYRTTVLGVDCDDDDIQEMFENISIS